MGDPILMAKRADLASFAAAYDPEVTPFFTSGSTGQTVLFGALANRDPQTRVAMANRLLDDSADASIVTTASGTTLLHVLLGQRACDPIAEAPLLRRLLDGGADVNRIHPRDGAPLAMLLRRQGLSHDDRAPLYDVFFERPDLDLEKPASKVHTVREMIEKTAPRVPVLQRLLHDYDALHGRTG